MRSRLVEVGERLPDLDLSANFMVSNHLGKRSLMPEVIIHDDESFERALKRFKKKCEKAGSSPTCASTVTTKSQ